MYKNPTDSSAKKRKAIKDKLAPSMTMTATVGNNRLEKVRNIFRLELSLFLSEFVDMVVIIFDSEIILFYKKKFGILQT